MKNKIIKNTVSLAVAVSLLGSCNGWLEATSSTQVSDATLYSSRSGFQDALCGVYISMGSEYEYGSYWTWYVNELVYGPYAPQSSTIFTAIQNHKWEYNRLILILHNMWQAGYFSIANANKVLYELDARPGIVSDKTERDLMRGELLALRAYIHFDMMRMFGLVQLTSEDDFAKLAIPYSTEYVKDPAPQRNYRETLDLLEKDLDEAITLLSEDPVRGNASETFMANANADGFWDNRDKRMNYFAAKALKVRVLLFKSELDSAYSAAEDLIAELKAANAFSWVDAEAMTSATSNDEVDWTFSSEQIFALEVSELQNLTDLLIFNASTLGSSSLLIDKAIADVSLFNPSFVSSAEDIRGPALMLKFVSDNYRPYKYYNNSSYYEGYRNRVPMIKVSELYLIMAEIAAERSDTESVNENLYEVRRHRGIQDPADGLFISSSSNNENVLLEYFKEFCGEGVAYYATRRIAAKRNSYVDLDPTWFNRILSLGAYPYPVDELSYGRKQEL